MKGFFGILFSIIFVHAVSCTVNEERETVLKHATSVEASLKEQIDWIAERYSTNLSNEDTSTWNTDEQVRKLLREKAVGMESRLLVVAKNFYRLKALLYTNVSDTPAHVANRMSPSDAFIMLYVLPITHAELAKLKEKIDEWKQVTSSIDGTRMILTIRGNRTDTWFADHGFKVSELEPVSLERLENLINELLTHAEIIFIKKAMNEHADRWNKEEAERMANAGRGISGAEGQAARFSFASLSVISICAAAVAVLA